MVDKELNGPLRRIDYIIMVIMELAKEDDFCKVLDYINGVEDKELLKQVLKETRSFLRNFKPKVISFKDPKYLFEYLLYVEDDSSVRQALIDTKSSTWLLWYTKLVSNRKDIADALINLKDPSDILCYISEVEYRSDGLKVLVELKAIEKIFLYLLTVDEFPSFNSEGSKEEARRALINVSKEIKDGTFLYGYLLEIKRDDPEVFQALIETQDKIHIKMAEDGYVETGYVDVSAFKYL